jgi:uncharacterized membrane protein YeaQ/YmgE (transglycosylase-associated protein family)
MAESTAQPAKTPWHLWVVGGLSLLWNLVGAFDFFMTQTKNEAYLKAFTPEQLAYFSGFPWWVVAAWALGTWGSSLGSLLLLVRRSVAVQVLGASLVGFVLTTLYTYVLSDGVKVMKSGAGAVIFSAVIGVIIVLLLVYARAMRQRGVLR